MTKKKRIIIGVVLAVAIMFVGVFFLLRYFLNYEINGIVTGVLMKEEMSEKQAEKMVLYKYTHFGIIDEETPRSTEGKKIIELTDDQKNTICSLIDGKKWEPHRRLWYRFDAIIKCGNKRMYMVDLDNGIIFIEELDGQGDGLYGFIGDVPTVGWNIRSCIVLSEDEHNMLKEELKGTGLRYTD